MTDLARLGFDVDSRSVGRATDEVRKLGDQGARTESKVKRSTEAMSTNFKRVGIAIAGVTAALASMGAATSVLSGYERQMAKVGAVSRATEAEMRLLRDTAADLGATTEFSATQAGEGLEYLALAGLSASEAVAALPGVLDFATAGTMALATASDLATDATSAMGLELSEMTRLMDVLANQASSSNTSVEQAATAIIRFGGAAARLGVDIETASAALGVLGDNGIKGAEAGTAMRAILLRLVAPTKAAADAMKSAGLNVKDLDVEARGLLPVLQSLQDAQLDSAQMAAIFGQEHVVAAGLLERNVAAVRQYEAANRAADGAVGQMAGTIRDQLGGDLDGLYSALQGIIISLGDAGLTAALRTAIQAMTSAARGIAGAIDLMAENADILAAALGLLAAKQIPAVIGALASMVTWLGTAEGLFIAGATAARGFAVALNLIPGVALLTGLSVALAGIMRGFNESRRAAEEYARAIGELEGAQQDLNTATATYYQNMTQANLDAMRLQAERNRDTIKAALEAAEAELEAAGWYTRAFGVELFETDRMEEARAAIVRLRGELVGAEARLSAVDNAGENLNRTLDATTAPINSASNATGPLQRGLSRAAGLARQLLHILGSVPAALDGIAGQVDSAISSLQQQNATMTYQIQQGLTSAAATIKAQRDEALRIAASQNASIDELAAIGAAFDEKAKQAEALAKQNEALTNTLNPVTEGGGGGGGAKKAKEEVEELTEAARRAEQILGQVQREAVTYADVVGQLSAMLNEGKISQEQFNAAVAKADEEMNESGSAFSKIGDDISGAIGQAENFLDMLERVGLKLAELALSDGFGALLGGERNGFFQGIGNALGGLLGGGATTSAVVAHTGGTFGRDSFPKRTVPASVFAAAPRFHGGKMPNLRAGERAAIVEDTETILTPGQLKSLGNYITPRKAQSGGGSISIGDTNLYVTEPGMDEAKMRKILADHQADTIRKIGRMNDQDPSFLHT